MERLTHRRADGSAYSNLDIQTCLNRLADWEDYAEQEIKAGRLIIVSGSDDGKYDFTKATNECEWQAVTDCRIGNLYWPCKDSRR